MPRHRDRDRLLEQLLRQPVTGLSSPGPCVDGETLAAWTAGGLAAAEAATVEEHVADCARCQTMLAALVRATPGAPAVDKWWRRGHVRWLVPLATAATVAAIWIAIPDQRADRNQLAVHEDLPDATPSDRPQQEEKEAAGAAPPPPAALAAPRRIDAPPPAPAPQAKVGAAAGAAAAERSAAVQDRLAKEADRPLAQRTAPRARDEAPATAAAAANAPSLAPAAPADPQALAETITPGRAPMGEFASPNAADRWRLAGAAVQHSTDAGRQWELATINSSDSLTAGHSPASPIAWIVGRRGSVYLTTDGSRFVRVPFVEPVDLVAVVGINDREATVTAADGRTFRTTDGGATWIRGNPDI